MHNIVRKEHLAEEVVRMEVEAPFIAEERKAGQFVIVQKDSEYGERIPLTIADVDRNRGTITLIFQTLGRTTHELALLEEGESIANILGPLGNPTHVENFGRVVCVGGGIGVAPLYPVVVAMAEAGNRVQVIMGARKKELVILEQEMRAAAEDCIVCTDDGSYGLKGLVTEPLKEICADSPPDLIVAVGPAVMMKACSQAAAEFNVPIIVSLNTIMVDGTGMCGGCRVSVGGETKFVCVDGPEFDGRKVDFENMILRLGAFKEIEDRDHHACHLELDKIGKQEHKLNAPDAKRGSDE